MPATNAAMNPDPSSALAIPYASAAPAAGMTGRHAGGDQVAPARLGDDRGDQQPGDHAAQGAVADLFHEQRGRAAPAGDVGLGVGDRDRREQQGDADPVVEAALDVEALADALRHARLGDHGLPERRVGRRQHDREDHRLPNGQLAEDRGGGHGAQRDRERQADPEQPHRHVDRAAQRTEVDARRVGEQDQCERRLRQRPDGRARARQVDCVENLGTEEQPEGDEQHRRGDRRPGQRSRNPRYAEQRKRHESERPLHLSASSGSRATRSLCGPRVRSESGSRLKPARRMCRLSVNTQAGERELHGRASSLSHVRHERPSRAS